MALIPGSKSWPSHLLPIAPSFPQKLWEGREELASLGFKGGSFVFWPQPYWATAGLLRKHTPVFQDIKGTQIARVMPTGLSLVASTDLLSSLRVQGTLV